ncbi:hypothetical protein F2Q69_00025164 [Brassica cretica]|uniref:Uncharacterized protein n=1 Tax=Brassica cretica TaxID=69181 RepID=A0A8S9QBH3_BRACR|nr:hypothetical protein F2Q69_00025164 [Brassica cretica]
MSDVLILHRLLKPFSNLSDSNKFSEILKSFYNIHNQALPSQLHPDLSSDEPLNSIPSRVPVTASARSDDQPQPVRERQPRRSRPNKPNPIASSQLAIPKQPARVRSRFILVVRFLQSAKQR